MTEDWDLAASAEVDYALGPDTGLRRTPVRIVPMNPPDGWIVHAAFPKDRYHFVLVDDEWLCYAPDDHGAFS